MTIIQKIRKIGYPSLFGMWFLISVLNFVSSHDYLGKSPVSVIGTVIKVDVANHAFITARFTTDKGEYIQSESGYATRFAKGDCIEVFYLKENPRIASFDPNNFSYSSYFLFFTILLVACIVIVAVIETNIKRAGKIGSHDSCNQ